MFVRFAYVSGNLFQCKTVYLTHMYKLKTKSANFVLQFTLKAELINISLLIINTDASGNVSGTYSITMNVKTTESENCE